MNLKLPTVRPEVVQLKGGLDTVTPALSLSPGACIDAVNFESDQNGGYRRIAGYERLDGRPSPTAAGYWIIHCTGIGSISLGDTVTGATSLKTGVVIAVIADALVLTKVSGAFSLGENLQVLGVTKAVSSSLAVADSADTPAQHAQYKYLASNIYRADILTVPGTGPVRGVWHYAGNIYAFRDTGAACLMYKATSSGWALQTFGKEVQFIAKAGAPGTAIKEGDTVTGATSACSGVVKRVLLRTGTWASNPVGTLVFDSITTAFTPGEALNVGGVGLCQTSGTSSQISLLAGGRFEFVNYNFGGGITTQRMYFCDGVNLAHEWDGTRLVPIRTGAAPDVPSHIAAWKNMLVLSAASSIQLSGIANPYSWTALTGAAELALGANCTGLLPQQGDASTGALAVFCDASTFILYGTSTSDCKLVTHSSEAGAAPYTAQNIGSAFYLDTKGVVSLTSTQTYGNFASSSITQNIQTLIDTKRSKAVASCILRAGQYLVFFNDGSALTIKPTGSSTAESMYLEYSESIYFNTVESFVGTDGVERVIAAGSDGFVYELNKGTSFDGASLKSRLFTAFNSNRYPRLRKRYKRAVLQATCVNTADVSVGYELDFGSSNTSAGTRSAQSLVGAGGYWDAMTWDSFNWDSPYLSEYTVDTPENGLNIGLLIYGDSAVNDSFTISSVILHYIIGRLER